MLALTAAITKLTQGKTGCFTKRLTIISVLAKQRVLINLDMRLQCNAHFLVQLHRVQQKASLAQTWEMIKVSWNATQNKKAIKK